jgi:hypothetical protein
VQDTFNLALAGPGALVAKLGAGQVTLAPGASQVVSITTTAASFSVPGALNLTAMATSQTNPAVAASATATLSAPTFEGLSAQFQTGVHVVPIPGTSAFLLLVGNTGNAEDAYTATIAGTSGPVTASLTGLDGLPAESIPLFRLPGLSEGAILLETNLAAAGEGRVTILVKSLTNPNLVASATATVTTPIAPTTTLTVSPNP